MKLINIFIAALGGALATLTIVGAVKKPSSVYASEPDEQNKLAGKRVRFVENPEEDLNADGVRGHLEVVSESSASIVSASDSSIPYAFSPRRKGIYERVVKRGLDIILSGLGLIILSPVHAVVSVLVYIDDPGPVLFTQKRVGVNKTYFKLHKFRSMRNDTPHDVPTHQLADPEQYITRVGKVLRKTSLDELPQIWDIWLGNMSVIGPRPALWNQDLLVSEREKWNVNEVKPGLTGLAQISGRDELEISRKAEIDGEYCRNVGLLMDLKCFFGTVLSVLKHDGVIEGGTGSMEKSQR